MGGIELDLQADMKDVLRMFNKVPAEIVPQSTAQAMNRTIKSVRTAVAKKGGPIHKRLRLKVGEIKKRIRIAKAFKNRLIVTIHASYKAVPLIQFGGRQTKKGVTVNVSGARKRVRASSGSPGAFITITKSGHKGIFKRRGKARTPIRQLVGPSVAEAFDSPPVEREIRTKTGKIFKKEFESALKNNLRRAGYSGI